MNITLDASHVLKELNALNEKGKKVEKRTLRDLRTRAPAKIASAVGGKHGLYQISSRDVLKSSTIKTGKPKGRFYIKGKTISSLQFLFYGKKHSEWKVFPSKPPKKRITINRNGKKRRGVQSPYQVRIETYKGKRAIIKGKNGHRVYVIAGRKRAFVVGRSNKPMIHASSSVPQAIYNKKVQKRWKRAINILLEDRFFHYFNLLMKK